MASRQLRYKARHKKNGLCVLCSTPALPGLTQCTRHAGKTRQRRWSKKMINVFIRLWRKGDSIEHLQEVFHVKRDAVYKRAKRLREKGVEMTRP